MASNGLFNCGRFLDLFTKICLFRYIRLILPLCSASLRLVNSGSEYATCTVSARHQINFNCIFWKQLLLDIGLKNLFSSHQMLCSQCLQHPRPAPRKELLNPQIQIGFNFVLLTVRNSERCSQTVEHIVSQADTLSTKHRYRIIKNHKTERKTIRSQIICTTSSTLGDLIRRLVQSAQPLHPDFLRKRPASYDHLLPTCMAHR